jgi:hypothetical protein
MCRIVDSMFPRAFEASITRLALLPVSAKLISEAAYAASEPAPGQCEDAKVNVAIDPGRPLDRSNRTYGQSGSPAQDPGRTIQLPIHESTYAHLYCRSRMKIPGGRPV